MKTANKRYKTYILPEYFQLEVKINMELTVYKADFTVYLSLECWHEFCGRCGWLEYEQ
jgi:hypothetical protein